MGRKEETLGMAYGTACGKLRKQLMFKFAQELGYDTCYKCEELITSIDELSIEHKEPWEGRENGAEKFWDLENIAFSHLRCNRPHVTGAGKGKRQQEAPEGTFWCSRCEAYLAQEKFYSIARRTTSQLCKEHNKADKNERMQRKRITN